MKKQFYAITWQEEGRWFIETFMPCMTIEGDSAEDVMAKVKKAFEEYYETHKAPAEREITSFQIEFPV
jgi:predicted RNase H-like HicB family nuclease